MSPAPDAADDTDPAPVPPARPKRGRKITLWVVLGLCLVLTVSSVGVAWVVRQSFPDVDGQQQLPGLTADVDVKRDQWGVPQIYADSATDLFAAQGFVHAQDRFFEMDFRRHLTSGRLSEMFGADQVETDAFIRTMGWRKVAEAEWKQLDGQAREYFTAYAEGVNAYLDGKSPGEVSLEYTMLGLTGLEYHIESWEPVDGLAWLKAMAWDLKGNYDDELDRAKLAASGFDDAQINDLYPPYPDQHAPIVTDGDVVDGEFDGDARVPPQTPSGEEIGSALDSTARATENLETLMGTGGADGLGSNSWVISGDLTATGEPLLANDPHLGAAMPSVWHQVGLRCRDTSPECPFDVAGFGFSGIPGVVIGHNGEISWGFTNLGPDVTDFYVERLDGDRYQVDGDWHDLTVRQETIEVTGGEDVDIEVRATEHGPLLSDVDDDIAAAADPPREEAEEEYGMSLAWTALEPSETANALFALNTAGDFEEFRDAAAMFEVPAQNLVYADTDGNIGYQAPGSIPVRGEGDGTMPAPGWDSDYDWDGYVPFDELPSVLNPEEGFIATANNQVIDESYPHMLTHDWAYGYRSERIRDMITDAGDEITADDVAAMQMDSRNDAAAPLTSFIGDIAEEEKCVPCGVLESWDLQQDPDSAGAALYNVVWSHLLESTFDELPDDMEIAGNERWMFVVNQLLEDPDDDWWDDPSTPEVEDATDVVSAALDAGVVELEEHFGSQPSDWRWGELHTLTVTHQSLGTSGIALVENIFNATAVESGGGAGLVNATSWNAASGYEVTAVPSMRMIVDMSDLDESQWINLTGNSGHAYHANYADQLPLWRDGQFISMNWSPDSVRAQHDQVLRLTP